jgi:hypothetical protein
MILIAFFCCMKILFMFACEVQLNILLQYSRCEWKKLVYKDFRALGVSVCLTLLRKNIERDSLPDRAVELDNTQIYHITKAFGDSAGMMSAQLLTKRHLQYTDSVKSLLKAKRAALAFFTASGELTGNR